PGTDLTPGDLVEHRLGWREYALLDADQAHRLEPGLMPDPAAYLSQGPTALMGIERGAEVRSGDTVFVTGAAGGVGSLAGQIARQFGAARVIGSTGSQAKADRLIGELGYDAVIIRGAGPVEDQLREAAPDGVDAVFDHVGGPGVVRSWRLLRRGGTLVSYGTAATKDEEGSSQLPVLKLFGQLAAWNSLPNGRSAHFYNFWAGRRCRTEWRRRLTEDLTEVLRLVADGVLTPRIAAEIPLSDAASALALAESRTVVGKVVLVPGT
ncbi:zinc-binding dehydrogenase, partial [Streptomyces rubiginosohelvolus]